MSLFGKKKCDFCGKKVHKGKGAVALTYDKTEFSDDSLEIMTDMQITAQEMATRKCVCNTCGSIFCLGCGNVEGHKRGTGSTHCPKCGTELPSDQLW